MTVAQSLVPPLTKPRRTRAFTVAERTLDTGLRVLVVRRAGVPLVELRLRVPFSGRAASHSAKAAVLTEALLSGTAGLSAVDIAIALQEIGGSLNVSADPDRLMVSGSALSPGLPRLLELLAEVLNSATYPADEVVGERDRLIERLRIARSQPNVIAYEALLHRMYGEHPYARQIPDSDAVASVTAAQLRSLHKQRLVPAGSTLVVVGDLAPQRSLDRIEAALSTWDTPGRAPLAPRLPGLETGPIVLLDRPESVQSNIRIGGRALPRQDPDYPAMQLANLVFGGYFSSRLVENIREEKGYSYAPHSIIDHSAGGSALQLSADVATAVTAPALLEMRYELGRVATLPVGGEELDSARQYAIGTLALSVATQAGLATTLSALLASGLGPDWLREHPLRLAAVTVDDVARQALVYLAPSRLVTVVVGDSTNVHSALSTLDEVVAG